ncbi:MAG: rod shape-determining protein MreC [Bacteroidota bacterium]
MKTRFPGKEVGLAVGLFLSTALFGWLSGRNAFLPGLLRPGLGLVQHTTNSASGFASSLSSLERLREENIRLRAALAALEHERNGIAELRSENARLKELLGVTFEGANPGMAARIVGRSPDNWFQRVLIDKGSRDGIVLDSPAVGSKGLIGKVTQVGAHASWITLVTDPSLSVSCLNQRTRVSGILAGQSSELPVLNYVQQQADFRQGDALVTSGFGGVFPKGIPVGTVETIHKDPALITPQIRIRPVEPLNRLEEIRLLPPLRVHLP